MPGLTQTIYSPPPIRPQHGTPININDTVPYPPNAPFPPPKPYSGDDSGIGDDAWLGLFAYTGIGIAGAIAVLIIFCCTSMACRGSLRRVFRPGSSPQQLEGANVQDSSVQLATQQPNEEHAIKLVTRSGMLVIQPDMGPSDSTWVALREHSMSCVAAETCSGPRAAPLDAEGHQAHSSSSFTTAHLAAAHIAVQVSGVQSTQAESVLENVTSR